MPALWQKITSRASGGRLAKILDAIDEEIASAKSIRPVLALLDRTRDPLQRHFCDQLDSPAAARLLTVKILNLLLAQYHFRVRSTALLSRPYGLVVDPVNSCNLACPGCVHSERAKALELFDWKGGLLSEDRYTSFMKRYGPYAIQTTLCNYGEPLMNAGTPKFIRQAKRWLANTTISTNMTAKKFDAEAYVLSGLDFMTLSIDGASQAVYEQYRRKGDIEIIFSNIRSLVEARKRLGKRTPVIQWQFLAFEHNVHEIEPAAKMARELGIDQITVATPFDVSWDDPSIRPANIKPFTTVFQHDSNATALDNWNPFPGELDEPAINQAFESRWLEQLAQLPEAEFHPAAPSDHMCHWLYKNMAMDAAGRIIPCCAAPRPDADLVYDTFTGSGSNSFNTAKYKLSRLSFADKAAYEKEQRSLLPGHEPHCANCDWYSDQQKALIDAPEIEKYFKSAGNELFDERSIRILRGDAPRPSH